jgi:glycosyltransferase involved in cell wall biosynthesis
MGMGLLLGRPVKVLSSRYGSGDVGSGKKALFIHTEPGLGGAQVTMICQCRAMLERGHSAMLLIPRGSGIERLAQKYDLPYYAMSVDKIKWQRVLYKLVLNYQVNYVARHESISFVQADTRHAVFAAKKASTLLKVAFIHQDTSAPRADILEAVDGMIGVSPAIVEGVKESIKATKGATKAVEHIPPFFEQEKFIEFSPRFSRQEFFKQFGIGPLPDDVLIMSMVGHMYHDWGHKNHRLLLHSLDEVVNKQGRRLHVFLAGDGPRRTELEDISKSLGLQEVVTFLGEIDMVPELLHHSDIEVLASSHEANAIVLVEGALMRKALIAAGGTGADNVIKHEQTGLLFTKDDKDSLARAIMRYIDEPAFAKKMGEQAFEFIKKERSPDKWVRKVCEFYESL